MRCVLKKLPFMAMQCCCMRDQTDAIRVHGSDAVLELVVQAGGFFCLLLVVLDGPAGDAFGTAFDPPAVQRGKRGHAVERGLHAGGTGGLVGPQRRVDPDVDALGELRSEVPVVVLEIDNLQGRGVEVRGGGEDIPDEAFATLVGGVGLAGEEDLQAADLLRDGGETGRIGERAGWRACRWRRDGRSRA